MRRFAASVLVGLALLGGTVAWSAFATGRTLFDRNGSERIADVLVAEPGVRDVLATALAKALRSGMEGGAPIPAAEVEQVARRVLDDPRTLSLLRTAIVGAHQRLLGAADGPVRLDTGAVAQAGRDALIEAHPELAASLPMSVPLTVELPTDKLPELAPVGDHLARLGRVAGLAAVWLLALAFLVASDRPRVLRRTGKWAVGLGLSSVVMGGLLPHLISGVGNPRLAVAGALAVAVSRPMLAPAVVLVAAGAGAMVVARAWRTAVALSPATPPAQAGAEAALPPVAA